LNDLKGNILIKKSEDNEDSEDSEDSLEVERLRGLGG
jgi:hypothetical protein